MEDGRVEARILDKDDEAWHSLTELVVDKPALSNMLHSILQLICSVSLGATPKVVDYARHCIPKDICLKCLGDVSLPDRIRARFCDLLRGIGHEVYAYMLYTNPKLHSSQYFILMFSHSAMLFSQIFPWSMKNLMIQMTTQALVSAIPRVTLPSFLND